MSEIDELLKVFLNQEVKNLNINDDDKVKTLLALIGLERIKQNNKKNLNEIDLKKIAGDFIK